MSGIDIDGINLDPDNMVKNIGNQLSQKPGTDLSGPGGYPFNDQINASDVILINYFDLAETPVNPSSVRLVMVDVNNDVSGVLLPDIHFSIVRRAVGGDRRRIVWDSTLPSNTGNGTPIPDNDTAPTVGLEKRLKSTHKFIVRYER